MDTNTNATSFSSTIHTQVTIRKNYTLTTERDPHGNYIKFLIKPNSYDRKRLLNCILILVANYIVLSRWVSLVGLCTAVADGDSVGTGRSTTVKLFGTEFPIGRQYACCVFVVLGVTVMLSLLLKNPAVESLTVYKGYGIQMVESRGLSLLPDCVNELFCIQEVEFVPRDKIVDIVINEGFVRQCQVIFYLAVIVRDAPKLKLLFACNRPRLVDQREIYNLSRKCLYVNKRPLRAH